MRISEWSSDVCSSDLLLRPRWARWLLLALALPTVLLIGFAVYGLWLLNRNVPVTYADPAEHFKYGSTRGEMESGLPYWIWQVLPRVCGKHLPDPSRGYASLGLIYEEGKDLPIGMSKRNYRSEKHTSELQSLMRTSYAVFCLKKKKKK